jgi:hypothetical protein
MHGWKGIAIVLGLGVVSGLWEEDTAAITHTVIQMMMLYLLDWTQYTFEFKKVQELFASSDLEMKSELGTWLQEFASCW